MNDMGHGHSSRSNIPELKVVKVKSIVFVHICSRRFSLLPYVHL